MKNKVKCWETEFYCAAKEDGGEGGNNNNNNNNKEGLLKHKHIVLCKNSFLDQNYIKPDESHSEITEAGLFSLFVDLFTWFCIVCDINIWICYNDNHGCNNNDLILMLILKTFPWFVVSSERIQHYYSDL